MQVLILTALNFLLRPSLPLGSMGNTPFLAGLHRYVCIYVCMYACMYVYMLNRSAARVRRDYIFILDRHLGDIFFYLGLIVLISKLMEKIIIIIIINIIIFCSGNHRHDASYDQGVNLWFCLVFCLLQGMDVVQMIENAKVKLTYRQLSTHSTMWFSKVLKCAFTYRELYACLFLSFL